MAENEEVLENDQNDTQQEPVQEEKEPSKKDKKKEKKETEALKIENRRLSEALERSNGDLADANDKYLRLFAEFDNYKKRTAQEQKTVYSSAYMDAVEALLPVFDNIERASAYASDENSKNGLQMIINNFREILGKMGIESYGEVGDEFNAEIHSAVMHEENEEFGENTVSLVLQRGYKKGDRVIRYAMVKVAN
ncbi:MAG: nucleotide exchange factor GrpE [Clostridia bacterium]|nr:nucleotide exchange factor GrpE [Clostridia bacterium]